MRRRTRSLLAILLLVAFAVPTTGPEPATRAQMDVVTVELSEYDFTPASITAPVGTLKLHIVSVGNRRHNLVMLIDGVDVASPHVRPGDGIEWEVDLSHPGEYIFWCDEYRHLEKGMTGRIIVE